MRLRQGSTPTPLQYVGTAGYYFDTSALTYVRARVLNTSLGRWMTRDRVSPLRLPRSPHEYALNRPATLNDASGLFSCWWCLLGIASPIWGILCVIFCDKGPHVPAPPKTVRECLKECAKDCVNDWMECRKCLAKCLGSKTCVDIACYFQPPFTCPDYGNPCTQKTVNPGGGMEQCQACCDLKRDCRPEDPGSCGVQWNQCMYECCGKQGKGGAE